MYKTASEALSTFNELKGTLNEEQLSVLSKNILDELAIEKDAGIGTIIADLAEKAGPALLAAKGAIKSGVAAAGESLGAAGTSAALSDNKIISGIGNKAMDVGAGIAGNPGKAIKSVATGAGLVGAGMQFNTALKKNNNIANSQYNVNNPANPANPQ